MDRRSIRLRKLLEGQGEGPLQDLVAVIVFLIGAATYILCFYVINHLYLTSPQPSQQRLHHELPFSITYAVLVL
jgi:hypothetical protein